MHSKEQKLAREAKTEANLLERQLLIEKENEKKEELEPCPEG